MRSGQVFVVYRDFKGARFRMPPWWSMDRRVRVAHRLASNPMGRSFRAYVTIYDPNRWSGTSTSATSTPSSAAGWIAGRELGSDF